MMARIATLQMDGLLCAMYQNCDVRRVMLGIFASLLMAGTVVLSTMMFPVNQGVALLSIIVIPFLISYRVTGNLIDALTIVWLNEVYFGVGGTWIQIGPIPGRGLLLGVVILAYIAFSHIRIHTSGIIRRKTFYIIFYGLIFPLFLFIYSVFACGATVSKALSDVMRFGTVLMYFPVRDLLRRNMDISFGWIIGATVTLALLFVTMSVGPGYIRNSLLVNWMSGGDLGSQFNHPDAGFIRAAMVPMIFCFVGVFLGIMYVLNSKMSSWVRLLGWLLTIVSLAPFVINFFRGPLLGIAVAIMMIFWFLSMPVIHWAKSMRLITMLSVLLISGYWISVNYIPQSLSKWNISGQKMSEIVDPVRIEQTKKMIDAWWEAPILGKGVGMPLKDYTRSGDYGLVFEVQYPMVLYRVGVLGFIIIMAPFIWMIIRTIRIWRQCNANFSSYITKLQMAVAFAIIALLTASCTNPYFATVMTPLFMVLFFALDEVIKVYSPI